MDDPTRPVEARRAALGRALAAHGEWLVAASNGKGVDRHLMGLRILAAQKAAAEAASGSSGAAPPPGAPT